ncbi:hypothetical protein M404DRAFT_512344 [Pisolithus tinctorius Marx 270]|uniref:Uncharacterized protein n=1 Tax=Pisolithus tinctorius Marx 270 TaxID=870435 RepID=A0A0C3K7K3_PISTI|nr:hypothetical protein M404DRAFT_512344 [Pisolithus tinctorius Marx 270]
MAFKYHALQFTKHYIASGSSDASEEQPLLRLWSTEVSSTQPDYAKQDSRTYNVPAPLASWYLIITLLVFAVFIGLISFQMYSRPSTYFHDGL